MFKLLYGKSLSPKDRAARAENGVDLFLLDFGVFFIFIYSSLTVTVGVFNIDPAIPGAVHVINGVVEILAVTAQTILIHQLLLKVIRKKIIMDKLLTCCFYRQFTLRQHIYMDGKWWPFCLL